MRSFKNFLESVPDGVIPHRHHLGEIQSIIEKQESRINQFVELHSEQVKIFAQIARSLEYGLKDETKMKEAVGKAIELAKMGYGMKSSDFSQWSKMRNAQ